MLSVLFTAVNDFLKVLDLSWNHLRLRGATAIGRALQVCLQTNIYR